MASPRDNRADLPPEERILLACAHSDLSAENQIIIAGAVKTDIDSERLLKLAAEHGIVYFVHQQLKSVPGVPPGLLERLKDRLQQSAARAMSLWSYQRRFNELFRAAEIQPIWIKGL